ncbi:MAG: hypothetical protein ABIG96_01490 [Candidatus Micrarchaeota archaeon]
MERGKSRLGLSGALGNLIASYHIYLLIIFAGILLSVSSATTNETTGGNQTMFLLCTPSPCPSPTPTPSISPSPSPSIPPVYHSECTPNYICASVEGAGDNDCTADADCQPSIVPSPSPSIPPVYHSVCNDAFQCVSVEGEGESMCQADVNCEPIASPSPSPSPTPQCTVPPDECSAENQEACKPYLLDDYCHYGGYCDLDSCSCGFEADQYCPTTGTVTDDICYYGFQSCTENGCGDRYSSMFCQEGVYYDVCDGTQGPLDLTGPVVTDLVAYPDPTNYKINFHATTTDTCTPINYSEFYFDECGYPGTGYYVYPADDGTYNEEKLVEYISRLDLILANYGIVDGRHDIYVRSQNIAGVWGECSSVPFDMDLIPPEIVRNVTIPYWACAQNPLLISEICDSQSPITYAEYFMDGNWTRLPNGAGYPMFASDGLFDELCEWVNATINNSRFGEGRHCVKLHGRDLAGNWGKMSFQPEVCFVIDRTPPTTVKTIGTPKVRCDYLGDQQEAEACYFVTQSTLISLNTTDFIPADGYYSDNEKIYYRVRYKIDFADPWGAWSSWILYSGPISFSEDSIHEIEYYSIDYCANEERHHFEIDIVDTKPPISEKTLGEPKALCGTGDDCDYFINQQTSITLTCEDQQPHPSDAVVIKYRYKVDDGAFTEWTTYSQPFTYKEDSRHELEWYCEDVLGNVEQKHVEVEKVDSQSPTVEKTVGDPKIECETEPTGGYVCHYYVNQSTLFTLTATDFGHAENKPIKIYYRICTRPDFDVDPESCTEWMEYAGSFSYQEDSYHTLEYYAVDYVGNKGNPIVEADFVDSQPPITEKFVGQPSVECSDDDPLGCDYYITQQTPITFRCVDPQPHPVNDATVYYRYSVDGGAFTEWVVYGEPFTFAEDSKHMLQYYCVDALGNAEQVQTEIDIVETVPPVTTKTVGEPKHACITEEECDWYITQQTPITLAAVDPEPHPVNDVTTWYKYCVSEVEKPYCTGWMIYTGPFAFEEDSRHTLYYYSEDSLGNKEKEQMEVDVVDTQPPSMRKLIGDPKVQGDGFTFITQDTSISIICEDGQPHPVDHVAISYRYRTKEDWKSDWNVWSDFENVDGTNATFTFPEDSIHELEYYCEDILGNVNEHEFETDVVDTQPPESEKTVGDPKLECETGDDCDYFITQQTPITLECIDPEPHPVNDVKINYKYCVTEVDEPFCTDWTVYTEPFTFKEDSRHALEWYCEDALGNKEKVQTEVDKVDSTPPTVEKTVGEPKHQCTPQEECDWYITQQTPITFMATDYSHVKDKPVVITYRYCTQGLSEVLLTVIPCTEWTNYTGPFTFPEDSWHELEYYATDALGNEGQHYYEYDIVETVPPVTIKTVGDPKVECDPQDPNNCDYYINQDTMITLECTDPEPHPVDHVNVYYRYSVDDGQFGQWMLYGEPFSFPEDSKHTLEYYCEDALGNAEQVQSEVDVVDSQPPATVKEVGDPKVECAYDDPLGCDYYITQQTPIAFTCEDPNPHPVGGEQIYYQYMVDDGKWTELMLYDEPFTFPQDSMHTLKYYCIDALGNTEVEQTEIDIVETVPPVVRKVVGDPKVWCDEEPVECEDGSSSYTYTINSDFDMGTLVGLEHDTVADQLQIQAGESDTYPIMWIANAGEDSLSKWDTTNNVELARYHTWFGPLANHDDWSGPAPSRTAVDADGNVYVANRHFDGRPADVIKIYADDWIDRNGNGVIDTSFNADSSGNILPSEMLQMTDSNTNNIIDPSEITDERVAWVSRVGPNNCVGRSLAIDLNGDIWLGCYGSSAYYKLDGDTGAILAGPISTGANTPYGALVDKYGILWGASLGNNLLRLDTNTNAVNLYYHSSYGSNYGVALGYDSGGNTHVYLGSLSGYSYIEYNSGTGTFSTPAAVKFATYGVATDKDGNILVSRSSTAAPYKFASDGSVIWNVATQYSGEGRGIVVDSNNDVWVLLRGNDRMAKYRGSDGGALGVFNTGRGPYTYSDATGLGFRASVRVGTWNVVHDAGEAGSDLGPVSWNANVPEGTELIVKVRSSENHVSWSSWETVTNGGGFATTPNGRYLEVQVSMKGTQEASPILYDLTVQGGCSMPNALCVYITSQTPITLYCDDPNPHPVDQVSIYYRVRYRFDEQSVWGDWGEWIVTQSDQVQFNLPEDSMHEVEYYCKDLLGNIAETQKELDIVDNQGPTVVKTVGDPKVACSDDDPLGCDYYITQSTPISFEATDPLPHPVNSVEVYYRYRIDGGEWSEWYLYEGAIYFAEDSRHELEYYAVDALGNEGPVYREVDVVESVPPVTTKTVGNPKHACEGHEGEEENCDYYITQQTPITLTAVDPEPHPVDNVETYYYYCLGMPDEKTEEFEWCSDEMLYEGPFTFPEDSRHTLFYHSIDELGNEEYTQTEIDIVDTQPPVVRKSMGKPAIPCSELQRDDCHYFITQDTEISLYCEDQYPHPVDHVSIVYRYNVDGGQWTEWMYVDDTMATIQFEEDSVHTIEYYCEDALGNKAITETEIDRVDTTPPETEKLIMGNKTACDEDEECDYYVCRDTTIGFSAPDGGPICHVDGVVTEYRYRIGDGEWSYWIQYDGFTNFSFSEEGIYAIEYRSYDQLNNIETVQSEIDIFDKQPPKVWVLNPTSGRWYHDGEKFSVYAPAIDLGNPASGFKECSFFAIDIHFEELTDNELLEVMRMLKVPGRLDDLLEYLDGRYELVPLGNVPYSDGVCAGSLQIPEESGLTDKAYLVVQITDRSCNTLFDFARDQNKDEILMDIDNTPPMVELVAEEGLDRPLSTGDYFSATLEAVDVDSELLNCYGEVVDEETEATFNFQGVIIDDQHCRIFGTVPNGLPDGSHTMGLYAMDREFNSGSVSTTMMVDNTPPSKAILSPEAGATYGQVMPIIMHASDISGINPDTAQYRVFEDVASLFGIPIGNSTYDSGWRQLKFFEGSDENGNYSADFNTSLEGLEDGKTYFLRARVCDSLFTGTLPSGAEIPPHCSDPEITFKIDLSGPVMPAGVTLSGTSLSWAAATDMTGVDHYNIYLNGNLEGTSTTNTFDTPGKTGTWTVSAVDVLGNEGAKAGVQAPQPTTPPSTNNGYSGSSGNSYVSSSAYSGGDQTPQPAKTKEIAAPTAAPEPEENMVAVIPDSQTPPAKLPPAPNLDVPIVPDTGTNSWATGFFTAASSQWQYGLLVLAVLGIAFYVLKRKK